MPTFDASASVEALDYDFSAVPNYPKELKARGTVTEPSDARIGAFLDGLKNMVTDAKKDGVDFDIPDDASAEEMLAVLDALTGDAFVEMMSRTARMFADLLSESPSHEQLMALPLRVRTEFYNWIMEQVVRPEAGRNAGTAQVVNLRTAATG
jgi:hypothetical protein